VHVNDPVSSSFRDISELREHTLLEIERFFRDYKVLENKTVGVDRMEGHEAANQVIRDSIDLYRKEESRLRGW
jgi:inorganic pyrophosphatase